MKRVLLTGSLLLIGAACSQGKPANYTGLVPVTTTAAPTTTTLQCVPPPHGTAEPSTQVSG